MKKGGELAEVVEVRDDLEDARELLEECDEATLVGEAEVKAEAAEVAGAHHTVSICLEELAGLDWRGGEVGGPRFVQGSRRTSPPHAAVLLPAAPPSPPRAMELQIVLTDLSRGLPVVVLPSSYSTAAA